jgi:hypothetical protein
LAVYAVDRRPPLTYHHVVGAFNPCEDIWVQKHRRDTDDQVINRVMFCSQSLSVVPHRYRRIVAVAGVA